MVVVLLFQSLNHVKLFCDPMDCSPPGSSVGFPRQEYWSRLPFPSPGDLPNPGIEPASPALAGRFFTTEPPGKPYHLHFTGEKVRHSKAAEPERGRAGSPPAPRCAAKPGATAQSLPALPPWPGHLLSAGRWV